MVLGKRKKRDYLITQHNFGPNDYHDKKDRYIYFEDELCPDDEGFEGNMWSINSSGWISVAGRRYTPRFCTMACFYCNEKVEKKHNSIRGNFAKQTNYRLVVCPWDEDDEIPECLTEEEWKQYNRFQKPLRKDFDDRITISTFTNDQKVTFIWGK